MDEITRAIHAGRNLLQKRARLPSRNWIGLLGRADGVVIDPDLTTAAQQFVFVQMPDGNVVSVYNNRVPPAAGKRVVVGYDDYNPNLLQVLSDAASYGGMSAPPQSYLQAHAHQHQWLDPAGGWDPVLTDIRAWAPMAIYPAGGLKVQVYATMFWTGTAWTKLAATVDLTAYIPTSAGQARYVLLEVDTSGSVVATAGSVGSLLALNDSYIPAANPQRRSLAAIRTYYGQTVIQETPAANDIYADLRFPGVHPHSIASLESISALSLLGNAGSAAGPVTAIPLAPRLTVTSGSADLQTLTAGSATKVTWDSYGRVTSGSALEAGDVPDLSGTYLTPAGHTAIGDSAPHHAPVTLGTANGLSLLDQQLSLAGATSGSAGSMSAADKAKLDLLTLPLAASITGGGTIALGGYTLTVPATGMAALLDYANAGSFYVNGLGARNIGQARHTTVNTAGNNLAIYAGGATSGATDKSGGTLTLQSGQSTGAGGSGQIKLQVYFPTGGIATATLYTAGSGYVAGEEVTVVQTGQSTGSGGKVVIDTVNGSGAVLTFHVSAAGTGYNSANAYGITVTGGSGTGFRLIINTVTGTQDNTAITGLIVDAYGGVAINKSASATTNVLEVYKATGDNRSIFALNVQSGDAPIALQVNGTTKAELRYSDGGTNLTLNAVANVPVLISTSNTARLVVAANGRLQLGTVNQYTGPTGMFNVAGNADIQQSIITGHTTQAVATPVSQVTRADGAAGISAMLGLTAKGSGANKDGGSILLNGKSSTTDAQQMARIEYLWTESTHNTRTSLLRTTTTGNATNSGYAGQWAHSSAGSAAALTVIPDATGDVTACATFIYNCKDNTSGSVAGGVITLLPDGTGVNIYNDGTYSLALTCAATGAVTVQAAGAHTFTVALAGGWI